MKVSSNSESVGAGEFFGGYGELMLSFNEQLFKLMKTRRFKFIRYCLLAVCRKRCYLLYKILELQSLLFGAVFASKGYPFKNIFCFGVIGCHQFLEQTKYSVFCEIFLYMSCPGSEDANGNNLKGRRSQMDEFPSGSVRG